MEAARPVPPWERQQVHRIWWYCLHCAKKVDALESSVRGHVKSQHLGLDSDPIKGEDYTNGDHLIILLDRWERFVLEAGDRFASQLASVAGVEDFVFEVGDGLPDE